MNKKVIIIGAGGHAKVIADIVLKSQDILVGFLDDNIQKGTIILEYEVLGSIQEAYNYQDCQFIIGIGSNHVRKTISDKLDVKWYTAIHPTATIAIDTSIDEGSVIMANAVINTSAHIGKHCIINTGSIVEHDNVIGDYVHISPNATLCGTVHIGEGTHIGASVTVKNNIHIISNCIIGAGCVVVKDIEEEGTYIGVPARRLD